MCSACITFSGCFHTTVFALLSLQILLLEPPSSDAFDRSYPEKPHQCQPKAPLYTIVTTPTAHLKAPFPEKKRVTFKENIIYLIPTRAEIFGTTPKTSLWYNSNDIVEFEKAAVNEGKLFMASNALNDFRTAASLYFSINIEIGT